MALESKNFKHLFLHFGGLNWKKKTTQWRVTLEWYVQCKVPTYGICSLPKSWTTIQIKKACFNHTHLEARCWDVLNKIHLGGWGPTQLQQNKTYSHEIQNKKTQELKGSKERNSFKIGVGYTVIIFHLCFMWLWQRSPPSLSRPSQRLCCRVMASFSIPCIETWTLTWRKVIERPWGWPMIQQKLYEIIWI